MFSALLLLALAAGPLTPRGVAPAPGLPLDGGVTDAGVADAGSRWKWIDGDGGWLLDGGSTDVLTLRVGETARVVFPFPIVLMQCDEPLLTLGATEDTLLLTGAKAGHTACGFWFYERAWPHRSMDVTVSK
jgi:cyclic lactone autoinducer peptide